MADKEKTVSFKIGRDAATGKFISAKAADHRRGAAVVETIKRPMGRRKRR